MWVVCYVEYKMGKMTNKTSSVKYKATLKISYKRSNQQK